MISIHAPLRGATRVIVISMLKLRISIHAHIVRKTFNPYEIQADSKAFRNDERTAIAQICPIPNRKHTHIPRWCGENGLIFEKIAKRRRRNRRIM